ncbi:hypothetical protein GQ53DRAFT_413768 [Thozetella sp. PMI_491]|nr:hypothetical protein GQ53DRAFT_413768 [Thozetella sp. PMI_491]
MQKLRLITPNQRQKTNDRPICLALRRACRPRRPAAGPTAYILLHTRYSRPCSAQHAAAGVQCNSSSNRATRRRELCAEGGTGEAEPRGKKVHSVVCRVIAKGARPSPCGQALALSWPRQQEMHLFASAHCQSRHRPGRSSRCHPALFRGQSPSSTQALWSMASAAILNLRRLMRTPQPSSCHQPFGWDGARRRRLGLAVSKGV